VINNKPEYRDLAGLIDRVNSESTAAALKNFELGKTASKIGAFIKLKFVFLKYFFLSSGYQNLADRFYSSVYHSLLAFLTALKTMKIQKRL
jgi:hypothetical protein